ncbi:MAG: hypothetical protein JNM90_17325 [Burkholderiales bacterium]|nr:hypothetical protein [Burkholderiales bacterium]
MSDPASDPPGAAQQRKRERIAALAAKGVPAARADGIAELEARIARWPAPWGDALEVLIHGDFAPPREAMHFAALGIVVEPGQVRDSILKSAACVVKARVSVAERTVAGVIDAGNRIATLLAIYAASVGGGGHAGWWCHLTHGDAAPAGPAPLSARRIEPVLTALEHLPRPVARRVRMAMVWLDEPRAMPALVYRLDVLERFLACWNAFECLVEAICLLKPMPEASRQQQLEGMRALLAARGAAVTQADVARAYHEFVAPGFEARACHALGVCFGAEAEALIERCFRRRPERERLANLRDAIASGGVDIHTLKERVRIENRHLRLVYIVFGMLARLVPVVRPRDLP